MDPNLQQQTQKLLKHRSGSIDAVFLTRVLRAFEDLLGELSKDALSSAASAPSDFEVVMRALLAVPFKPHVSDPTDPLVRARLRGQQARLNLLNSEGGTLSVGQVAELLGITRQAVNKRRQTGRLLALSLGGRGFAYPTWQFSEGAVLPGLTAVLEELADHDPWMQARFFLSPNLRLEGSRPLDEIRRGKVEGVLTAAKDYGEQGAA